MEEQLIPTGRSANGCRVKWTSCLKGSPRPSLTSGTLLVGVLPGEGIGPEILSCAIRVVEAALSDSRWTLDVEHGGAIGRESEAICGEPLPADIVEFCQRIFQQGGAILNGPGGGRYVYDLRRRLDLFLKISPLQADKAFIESSPCKPEFLKDLDLLVVRENSGGIYQGTWEDISDERPFATHQFQYTFEQVERFLEASARLAKLRRGKMTVVWKESGIPAISRLWRDCVEQVANQCGVEYEMVDVDLMAYRLIQAPSAIDVLVAPNLFGDVLGDLGAVLLGSRGVSFSGNYDSQGHAVYQTNHGAAYDLAGTDCANPIGQIFSASMMLRESFGLFAEADAIEAAVRSVWQEGWRTRDMHTEGSRIAGTQEMGELIAQQIMSQGTGSKSAA